MKIGSLPLLLVSAHPREWLNNASNVRLHRPGHRDGAALGAVSSDGDTVLMANLKKYMELA